MFVRGGARVRGSGPGAERWKRQRKRKRATSPRGEAAEKLCTVKEEEQEAAEVGQGRREGARRWRRKFTTRRPPELPTLPRRLRALFQVGFLASCTLVLPSCAPSPLPARQVHLRNNTWYTVPRSRRIPVTRYTPSTVTM